MVDPLPVLVLGDDAGGGGRGRLVGMAPAEGGVARAAAPRLARCAEESLLESVFQTGRDIFRRYEVVLGFPGDRFDFRHGVHLQKREGFSAASMSRAPRILMLLSTAFSGVGARIGIDAPCSTPLFAVQRRIWYSLVSVPTCATGPRARPV
jgi:hypothetical protein